MMLFAFKMMMGNTVKRIDLFRLRSTFLINKLFPDILQLVNSFSCMNHENRTLQLARILTDPHSLC